MCKTIMVVSVAILLSACAGATKPISGINCSDEDWKARGLQTAKDLKTVRTFDTYMEQCGSQLASTAKSDFVDGYARGLVDVCTFKSGFDIGASNQNFPDVCPLEIRADFQRGYRLGKRDYQAKVHNMNRIEDERAEREREPFRTREDKSPTDLPNNSYYGL
jgi:hypothetical protein